MVNMKVEGKPLTTKILIMAALGFIIFWQCTFMFLWFQYPFADTALLRFSLSNADAISIFAFVVSLYAYHRFEKSSESEDMKYLQDIVLQMKEAGITPKMVKLIVKAKVGNRIVNMEQRLKDGKVTEEEITESLK